MKCLQLVLRRAYSVPARTRFAPSPTGHLHLGSLRTALYNFLWARKTKGQFIVRIEDTDRQRLHNGAEASLFNDLRWSGLNADESVEHGGQHGPYRQSDRLDIYQNHIKTLLDNGSAYRCFCSSERLRGLRESARANGQSGTYDRKCLGADHSSRSGDPHVIRLKTPDHYPLVTDIVHGSVKFHHNHKTASINFDDPVLIKSDGYPTYHFANIVDDHLMKITHVIRGEEWLPSTPKHLALYEAFSWTPPQFAHVPLLAAPSGAKLSKRHGDVTVEDFRKRGILPEALVNYLALMGWNSPGKNEVMTLDEMVEKFDLSDITKGAAIVMPEKLNFLQKQHYMKLVDQDLPRLVGSIRADIKSRFGYFSDEYIGQVIIALKERTTDPLGVPDLGHYFFQRPTLYSPTYDRDVLRTIRTALSTAEWSEAGFDGATQSLESDNKSVMKAIRHAVANGKSGAPVKSIMLILGREEVMQRFANAINH